MKFVNVFLSTWIYLIYPPTPKCQTLTSVKFLQKEHMDDKNGLERREENGGKFGEPAVWIRCSKPEHGSVINPPCTAVLAGSLWEADSGRKWLLNLKLEAGGRWWFCLSARGWDKASANIIAIFPCSPRNRMTVTRKPLLLRASHHL